MTMNPPKQPKGFAADELDLLIVGELIREPESTYKRIATIANVDQRTIARRIKHMKHAGIVKGAYEVNWTGLGVKTSAFVGCSTSVGEKSILRLRDYLKGDPRVVESYETVGAHEYILKVLGNDLVDLRDSILRDLEPLTADLTASVVSSEVKSGNYFQFVRYLRETRYPKTRSSSWGDNTVIKRM
jgi:DNA-binding Lrp family transcriptional regulator